MPNRLICIVMASLTCWMTATITAQDMPLSQVLIDGEGWERVADGFGFTDGATSDAYGGFYFSDVAKGNSIFKIDNDGKVTTFVENAPKVSGMQFGSDGKLYACQAGNIGRIVAFDRQGKMEVVADGVQPNDLVVAANGNLYFTETRKKQVTLIRPGAEPVAVDTGIARPNGIALTADQGTLAVSDHGGDRTWVFRINSDGSLAYKQPYMFMRLPAAEAPSKGDGMTTDSSGRYYVTSAVGLQMFDPTGRMGGVIAAPADKPLVSVDFAGPDLSYLYVCCGDAIYRRKTKAKGVLCFMAPSAYRGQ